MKAINRVFKVNGQPFFPLGGQARNSSGYNDQESLAAFQALKLIHGNTLEIPVYWGQVEPVEGQFDFTPVDRLLARAREHGVRLVLLWFGTWKNGRMEYVPGWVKADPQRFSRVITPTGSSLWVLSSHCQETFDADRRAFVALCRHLAEQDGSQGTVIAIQVENEPGILGSDRDYSPLGQIAFESPAPPELVARLRQAGRGQVYDLWQQAGELESGSWGQVFGAAAGELLSAMSIARYIDGLAEAGKAVHNIPMYINVWLSGGWRLAGESYPSGGAVGRTLDIYKWFTPHIDLIAPDIYLANDREYTETCALYARPDNPLFIPESNWTSSNPWNLFRALGDYDAIGYAFFGLEHILDEKGDVRPEHRMIVDSFHSAAAVLPLLLKYQGTGRVHTVVQEENLGWLPILLEGWLGLVDFGDHYKDWRHPQEAAPAGTRRGRGLVIQAGPDEFYLAGADFRLMLRRNQPNDHEAVPAAGHYLSVDEGHFDAQGGFVIDRRRNGDEINFGVWAATDVGVVRVILITF